MHAIPRIDLQINIKEGKEELALPLSNYFNKLLTNSKLPSPWKLVVLANSWSFTSFQSGFIKGDSSVNQLAFFYNDVSKALDEEKEVRTVFCDVSKAFDRIWHQGLIHKLSSIGISGSCLHWFSSYLSERKQRVVLSNYYWI